jgi:signal transduction histidine kinase/CheY-like chemotaxis protein
MCFGSKVLRRPFGWCAALAGALMSVSAVRADEAAQAPFRTATLAQRQPLTVGTVADTFPYSYTAADGQLAGFAHDVFAAAARAVNLPTLTVRGPARDIRQRFQNGEFDVLEYEATSSAPYVQFTVPFLSLQGCIFVNRNSPIRRVEDLDGRTLAVLWDQEPVDQLMRQHQTRPKYRHLDTQEEILRAISAGQLDAGFLSQLTELTIAAKDHLTNIRMLGRPYNNLDIRLAYAVHAGDDELIGRLNEGLALIRRSGEYDQIYRRNFTQFGSYILTADQVELYASIALSVAFVVALGGYWHQRRLRTEMAGQAATLAQQGALLQALYDNIPMAMTVIEPSGAAPRVVSMNRQACALYAVDPPAEGQPLGTLAVSAEVRDLLREAAASPRRGGPPLLREVALPGGKRFLEVTGLPLRPTGDTGPERVCVLVEDVTERKRQEAEMARSRRLRAVGELVGGIAHEFNNLLTPVMMKAGEIQLARPGDDALQRDLEVILTAVQRSAELTRRLLTFGRKADPRPESVRIATIAAACFDLLRHTTDRRIAWEQRIPADLPPLYFNATDLNQVLLNLLLNARDALMDRLAGNPPESWVPTISVEALGLPPGAYELPAPADRPGLLGWQEIRVRDNGLGMPPNVVERIFEPFFTTKDVGKGTGLGLATVWHLVTDAGGQVRVESAVNVGSAFFIILPVWPPVTAEPPAAAPAAPSRPARVLLVEDEPLVSLPMRQLLQKAGHTLQHRADGGEAWAHLEANLGAYDLLIADVNLPGLNGIDLVSRARDRNFAGRILMVSGRFTAEDLHNLTRLRIDHSITKPFNAQQFLLAVDRALAPPAPAAGSP